MAYILLSNNIATGYNLLYAWYYRCESFNSLVRSQNIYSNRRSPSTDIATSFATLDYLQYIVSGGQFGQLKQRLVNNYYTIIYNEKYFSDDHFCPCHYMRAWIRVELPVVIAKKSWIRVLDTPSCYERAAPPRGQTESPCGFDSTTCLIGQKCRAVCTIAQLPELHHHAMVIHSNHRFAVAISRD